MWLNSHDPKWLNFKRPLTDGKERAEQEILNLKTAYAFVQE